MRLLCRVAAALVFATCVAGCPSIDIVGNPLSGTVTLEIVNDTGFRVDPDIRTTDDEDGFGFFNRGDSFATSLALPGETLEFNFDCDVLAAVFSDAPVLIDDDGQPLTGAQSTDAPERGRDYGCGDVVRFRFIGDEASFGVIVSVNGRIVASS